MSEEEASKKKCNQEQTIKELRDVLYSIKTSHALLSQSYSTLVESHSSISGSVTMIQKDLSNHILEMRDVNSVLKRHSDQFEILFARSDRFINTTLPNLNNEIKKIQIEITAIKSSIGDISIAELDKRLGLAESLLKGVSFIAGAFVVAIVSIGVAAVYGG